MATTRYCSSKIDILRPIEPLDARIRVGDALPGGVTVEIMGVLETDTLCQLMNLYGTEGRAKDRSDCFCRLPQHRRKIASRARLGRLALAMATRQTDGTDLPDVGLFRDLILAHGSRAGHDGAGALVAFVSGEVQVVFSHLEALRKRNYRLMQRFGRSPG